MPWLHRIRSCTHVPWGLGWSYCMWGSCSFILWKSWSGCLGQEHIAACLRPVWCGRKVSGSMCFCSQHRYFLGMCLKCRQHMMIHVETVIPGTLQRGLQVELVNRKKRFSDTITCWEKPDVQMNMLMFVPRRYQKVLMVWNLMPWVGGSILSCCSFTRSAIFGIWIPLISQTQQVWGRKSWPAAT